MDPPAHTDAGREDPLAAAEALEAALTRDPQRSDLRLDLARLYRDSLGEQERALEHLYELCGADADDRVAWEFMVWTGLECSRPDVVMDLVESRSDRRHEELVRRGGGDDDGGHGGCAALRPPRPPPVRAVGRRRLEEAG